jgi:hypothetical protein
MTQQYVLTLDSSQIYEIQTCPLRWYYRYIQNLELAGADREAPDKGTLIHWLADQYYNYIWNRPHENKINALNYALSEFISTNQTQELFPEDKEHVLRDFLMKRFTQYTQRYFNDDFYIMSTKVSPAELGFSKLLYEDAGVKFIVEGRIDLVTLVQGSHLAFVDHKTQSRESTLYHYKPQFKTYAWATGCEYGIINYIGLQEDKNNEKMKKNTLFRRDLIHFNPWMIEEWELKMKEIFNYAYNLINDLDFAEKVCYLHRNDSACAGAFDSNPCPMRFICEEGNWEMKEAIKKFKYKVKDKWMPWEIKK